MSLKFCPKCGEKLEENAKFCNSCGADLSSTVKISEITPVQSNNSIKSKAIIKQPSGEAVYANFGPRLGAIIIDGFIIGALGSMLSWIFFPLNFLNLWGTWQTTFWQSIIIDYIIGFLYFWALESYNKGQTVGKMALKLRTVDETTLQIAEPGKNAINSLAKPSGLLILDFLIGIFTNTGDEKKRIRLLQNLSGTVVISEKYT